MVHLIPTLLILLFCIIIPSLIPNNYNNNNNKLNNLHNNPLKTIPARDGVNITVDPSATVEGSVATIAEAIAIAPNSSMTPFVIHIVKGLYDEGQQLVVPNNKINIWFIGDGIGQTIITGNKSVNVSKIRTELTAPFFAFGDGLLLQEITFQNTAGIEGEQAVALCVLSDRAVIYRCEIKGYQDSLWVARNRQFYRECHIYGTIDFIFGDASVIFQNCTVWARRPEIGQMNVITAQGRDNKNGTSGIVFQSCRMEAAPDLFPMKSEVQTFLGRPWNTYARVVYMKSYLGDHIDPEGWQKWDETAPLEHLYFGEFQNYGPGSNISVRVNWTSVHPKMSKIEAKQYTVFQFIQGQSWINSTGIPFDDGLEESPKTIWKSVA